MRLRLAPMAARMPISRSRVVARASSMLATLQQAITIRRLTAPNSVYNTPRNSRTTQSMTVMTSKARMRRIVLGIFRRPARGDHVQLRFGLGRRDTRAQVRLKRPEASRRPRIVTAVHLRRQPEIDDVPLEPWRHHADDGSWSAAEHERAADDARVGVEEPDPRAMGHDRNWRRTRRRIGRAEHPPDLRRHAEEREAVGGHPRNRQALRAGFAHPMHGVAARPDHVLERLRLLQVVEELRRREIGAAMDAIRRILQEDIHHAIGSRVRKGIEDDVAEDAVDDRDGADAEGQREDGHRREPGRPAEGSRCVHEIAPRVLQPAE